MKIKNRHTGQTTQTQEIVEEARNAAWIERERTLADVLDEKAHTVYLERVAAAKAAGANETALDQIDARDVQLTLGDRLRHALRKLVVVQIIECWALAINAEPDYSGIRPF